MERNLLNCDMESHQIMKKNIVFIVLSVFLMHNHVAMAADALGWNRVFVVGYGVAHANQTQILRLANTPLPGLENRYVGGSSHYGAALFGLALEKEYATASEHVIGTLGVEADYLRDNAVTGTVEPFYNISPDFDELKYFYDIHTFLLQATAKLTKQQLFYDLGGYAGVGLGVAVNRLSDYREYSPDDSSAAPMLSPFGNKDTINPSLSAGLGLTYKMGRFTRISLGYRFFYTGEARLKKSPVQQSNKSIALSPISYHFLMLGLSV
mgnify:CR=1 FL=1|tara:strand:+ start:53 stop:850 length:798 start_codon:yes stop_codon:yes gene_type:complete